MSDSKRSRRSRDIARQQQRRIKSSLPCRVCDGMGMVIEGRWVQSPYKRHIQFAVPCRACKHGRVPLVDRKTVAAGGAA